MNQSRLVENGIQVAKIVEIEGKKFNAQK